jgi:ABC-type xylose transport system permease subunit
MNTSFYSLTAGIGRRVFNAFSRADRDNARVSADQADSIDVWLFVAIGLLVAPAFFILGSEIARMLAAFS